MHHLSSEGKQDGAEAIQRVSVMREEYDFSQSVKNPYAKHLRKPLTIPLGKTVCSHTVDYPSHGKLDTLRRTKDST